MGGSGRDMIMPLNIGMDALVRTGLCWALVASTWTMRVMAPGTAGGSTTKLTEALLPGDKASEAGI